MKNESMLEGTRVTKESRDTKASGVSPEIWEWMRVRVVITPSNHRIRP